MKSIKLAFATLALGAFSLAGCAATANPADAKGKLEAAGYATSLSNVTTMPAVGIEETVDGLQQLLGATKSSNGDTYLILIYYFSNTDKANACFEKHTSDLVGHKTASGLEMTAGQYNNAIFVGDQVSVKTSGINPYAE